MFLDFALLGFLNYHPYSGYDLKKIFDTAVGDNNIYIVPDYPEKKTCWHNLEGGKDVTLLIKGQTRYGTGTLLDRETDAEEILSAFGFYP